MHVDGCKTEKMFVWLFLKQLAIFPIRISSKISNESREVIWEEGTWWKKEGIILNEQIKSK